MKLPEPKQKENGKWLVQVQIDGKRRSKEFETKEEALYWASGIKTGQKEAARRPSSLTVEKAIEKYIETKSSILSPSTIRGYRGIKESRIEEIKTTQLSDLTHDKVQRWVNSLAKNHSPKTVANAHGLLSAVLREYHPDMVLHTTLPQKVRPDIQIPTEDELKKIIEAARGTRYELPITLAIWLGLRQSEIVGLTWSCIKGDTLQIRQAIVMGEDGPTQKGTKSYSGKREIRIPPYIQSLLDSQPRDNAFIVNLSGKAIYSGFSRICEKAGVPHFRFHDLRHANASVMLAVGVPDKYSMKRMGHATNNMLKTTYQHTIKEKELAFDQTIDSEFEKMFTPK
jgi:integrase